MSDLLDSFGRRSRPRCFKQRTVKTSAAEAVALPPVVHPVRTPAGRTGPQQAIGVIDVDKFRKMAQTISQMQRSLKRVNSKASTQNSCDVGGVKHCEAESLRPQVPRFQRLRRSGRHSINSKAVISELAG